MSTVEVKRVRCLSCSAKHMFARPCLTLLMLFSKLFSKYDMSCPCFDKFELMRIWICHVDVTALRQNILSFAMLQFDSVNTEQTATLSHTSQLHHFHISCLFGCQLSGAHHVVAFSSEFKPLLCSLLLCCAVDCFYSAQKK